MPFIESYFEDYRDFFVKNALVFEQNEDLVNEWLIGKYNILLGYYSVLDLDRNFHYYLSANYDDDNEIKEIVNIGEPHIPIIDEDWSNKNRENIFKTLRTLFAKESTLKGGKLTPKFCQHYNHKEDNVIHRLYANTLVQIDEEENKDISQYEVQVVLAEEILFFIFFKDFEGNGSQFNTELKKILEKEIRASSSEISMRFNFHQLVKYTASVEAKICPDNSKLNDYFKIKNKSAIFFDHKFWGTKNEGSFRGVIDETIQLSTKEERDEILDLIWEFMTTFKDYIKTQEVIANLNLSDNDSIAEVISRFDINSVWDIWMELDDYNKCMWDILIFPMYKSFRYKDVKINTISFQENVTINNPVMFHAFVKPVYQIAEGKEIDESVETLFGFHLTKEVCRHYSKSLIENVFVGQTIQHSLRQSQVINAIARVMARNQSHNIGSHVLSRMVDPDEIKPDRIMNMDNSDYCSYLNNGDEKVDHFRMLANFLSYLKTRQDFLANIVSSTPQVQTTRFFIADVMNGIDSNKILLNKISGLRNFKFGFSFEGSLVHKSQGQGNQNITHNDLSIAMSNDIMGNHALYIILENLIRNIAKHGDKNPDMNYHDIRICMKDSETDSSLYQVTIYGTDEINGKCKVCLKSSETLGNNGISNFYKANLHNFERRVDNSLEYEDVININQDDSEYYIKSFNVLDFKYLHSLKKEIPDGTGFEISDYFELNRIDQLLISQNVWINKPILNNENFDLRLHSLGLIEMKACAAYLRRIPIEKIDSSNYKLKFNRKEKEIFIKEVKNQKNELRILRAVRPFQKKCLGYRFYIPKPKELLIIDGQGDLWNYYFNSPLNREGKFKNLEASGILFLNGVKKQTSKQNDNMFFDPNKIYQHQMLLIIGDIDTKHKTNLPKRQISLNKLILQYNNFYTQNIRINEIEKLAKLFLNSEVGTKNVKLETLRSIVRDKYILKALKPKNFGRFGLHLDKYNAVEYSGFKDFKPYAIKISTHGAKLENDHNEVYYEILPSEYSELLKKIVGNSSKDILTKLKYLAASITNILVLDERIQEQSYQKYKFESSENQAIKSMSYREIWEHVNVIIPSNEEINLSAPIFEDNYIEKIKNLIKEYFYKYKFHKRHGLDYLIIHLGIVERVLDTLDKDKNSNKNRMWLISQLISESCEVSPHIVFISGRAPRDLPKEVSYLSYSVLSQYIIENRFKLNLVEVLNSSRYANQG